MLAFIRVQCLAHHHQKKTLLEGNSVKLEVTSPTWGQSSPSPEATKWVISYIFVLKCFTYINQRAYATIWHCKAIRRVDNQTALHSIIQLVKQGQKTWRGIEFMWKWAEKNHPCGSLWEPWVHFSLEVSYMVHSSYTLERAQWVLRVDTLMSMSSWVGSLVIPQWAEHSPTSSDIGDPSLPSCPLPSVLSLIHSRVCASSVTQLSGLRKKRASMNTGMRTSLTPFTIGTIDEIVWAPRSSCASTANKVCPPTHLRALGHWNHNSH